MELVAHKKLQRLPKPVSRRDYQGSQIIVWIFFSDVKYLIILISLEESVGELDVFVLPKSLLIEFSLMSFGPCAECRFICFFFRTESLSNRTA